MLTVSATAKSHLYVPVELDDGKINNEEVKGYAYGKEDIEPFKIGRDGSSAKKASLVQGEPAELHALRAVMGSEEER